MGYKLEKPFTDTQKADFVCEHQGLNYYEDANCIIMYLDSENVIDGVITDILGTDEYKAKVAAQENTAKKIQLQSQIDGLDKKRIRAIAEPSIKDTSTDQTWLEYYTSQIQDLRAQINTL